MKLRTHACTVVCALFVVAANADSQVARERVRANDNRARAGILSGRTLALRMEARLAEWHPDGEDRPGALVPVFAEIGRQASIPGPLIRVPAGTNVITVVRNAVPNTILTLHGLHSRPVVGAAFNDSIQLAYGQIQTLRFRLDRPGTYYYWGTTSGASFGDRVGPDAQLSGAIVVDEPEGRPPADRILVIGGWTDSVAGSWGRRRPRELFVVNGRAWPQTDHLTYRRGETVRWRVLNTSADVHPMHLHGSYFRVQRRGDGKADTVYGAHGDLEHTERMVPGETMYVTWVADRIGGWLFHCAIPEHSERRGPLGLPPQQTLAQAGEIGGAALGEYDLGGLVTEIDVHPAEDDTTAIPTVAPPVPNARHIRMLIRPGAGSTGAVPLYDVAFDRLGAEPPLQPDRRAGATLVLTRGEPVTITVINRAAEPTSIHWHGVELESYYDGVPGISGVRPEVAPAIAPGDSFEVRLTPSRAGTFTYHSHFDQDRQLRAGLAGALIVADRGRRDSDSDIAVLITSPADSLTEERAVLINGALTPLAVELRRGSAARVRLMNATASRPDLRFELRQDSSLVSWRQVARDGATIPAPDRATRPGAHVVSIGETADMEFTPIRPGDLRLEVRASDGALLGTLPMRVP